MTIYTLGYSGWRMQDIKARVEALDAVLVDVRMVPRSRCTQWNGSAFAGLLGARYIWLKELGNRNYKGDFDQIEVLDFPGGESRLREIAGTGRAIILLCGCANVNECHRKLLADWLAHAWSTDVVHLTPPDKNAKPGQQTIF